MIYNCKKRIIYPPKNFITYNCDSKKYKTNILVDECLADEIENLWNKGIRTTGCCCGHGKYLGFINVCQDDDIEKMEHLGYQHYIFEDDFGGEKRKDKFIPKSYGHPRIMNKKLYIEDETCWQINCMNCFIHK